MGPRGQPAWPGSDEVLQARTARCSWEDISPSGCVWETAGQGQRGLGGWARLRPNAEGVQQGGEEAVPFRDI